MRVLFKNILLDVVLSFLATIVYWRGVVYRGWPVLFGDMFFDYATDGEGSSDLLWENLFVGFLLIFSFFAVVVLVLRRVIIDR